MPQSFSNNSSQSVKSFLAQHITQDEVQVEEWIFCEAHTTISAVQLVVVSQRQGQLVFNVWIEVVGIIVDYIFHHVDSPSLFEVANNRQRPADHIEAGLRGISSRNVFALFFGAMAEIGRLIFPA